MSQDGQTNLSAYPDGGQAGVSCHMGKRTASLKREVHVQREYLDHGEAKARLTKPEENESAVRTVPPRGLSAQSAAPTKSQWEVKPDGPATG